MEQPPPPRQPFNWSALAVFVLIVAALALARCS